MSNARPEDSNAKFAFQEKKKNNPRMKGFVLIAIVIGVVYAETVNELLDEVGVELDTIEQKTLSFAMASPSKRASASSKIVPASTIKSTRYFNDLGTKAKALQIVKEGNTKFRIVKGKVRNGGVVGWFPPHYFFLHGSFAPKINFSCIFKKNGK